jgi:hypothetical protein
LNCRASQRTPELTEIHESIENYINRTIQKITQDIIKEPNFENKQVIMATAAGSIIGTIERQWVQRNEEDYEEDYELRETLHQIINNKLKPERDKLEKWLNKERWIIGKTVTEFDPSWTQDERAQLEQAKIIFDRCADYNGSNDLSILLAGYQTLDYTTQQALNSAIQQQQQQSQRREEDRLNTLLIPKHMIAQPPLDDTSAGASDDSLQDAGGGDVDDYVVVSALGASDNSGQDTSQARGLVQRFKALMF